MHLQEAIARQIANNEARNDISGIDIADAGNVLQVVKRFLDHNLRQSILSEGSIKEILEMLEQDHMP